MTRKTVEMEITNEQAEKLYNNLEKISGGEIAGRWFTGCMIDEFAIVPLNQDWKIKMLIGRPVLARKYVFAKEVYLNCWSSKLVLVLTDNKKEFLEFVESRFENDENLDLLDFEDFCFENDLND